MTIYHTNIAKDYALSAGFGSAWAGIREILQNALDGHDKGYYMRIDHGKARDRSGSWALKVMNEGITLTRDALVLGFSSKRNDASQRGQHGEGLVVGINALLNWGHEVWIRTGDEAWIAKHQRNERGLEVLVIDIRKQPKHINDFVVEIKGVSPQDWESYQERLLFFGDKNDRRISLERGTILLDPKYKNKLFVKGIYVCELPDDYSFGYNLNIHLNRDREVADPWLLTDTIREVIMDATSKNLFKVEEILEVLENENCGESQAFAHCHFWGDPNDFHQKIAENFIEKHGENSLPVSSLGDSQRVEHFGKKGITVSKAIKNIIEKFAGSLDDRLQASALDISKKYGWIELTSQERDNIIKTLGLISEVEDWVSMNILNIVDFVGDSVRGSAKVEEGGYVKEIRLSKSILLDKAQLLRTFVHEVAHKYGDDGENAHEDHQYRILSEIIVRTAM